jgi:hypothetical protein
LLIKKDVGEFTFVENMNKLIKEKTIYRKKIKEVVENQGFVVRN